MHDIDHIALEGSIHEMRLRIANEQGAMHKVRQAVARWRNEPPAPPRTEACPPLPCQSRWHADAQCHFMCWLAAGGFAQAEAQDNSTPLATPSVDTRAASSCVDCPN